MHFVTIPFDYLDLSAASQAAIVPICIARNDAEGRPIAWGWFEAAARIPEVMLSLARRYLEDVWRASELAEGALHRIWYLHGNNFGEHPELRLHTQAVWHARDLQAGSWQHRRGVVKALESLEQVVRQRVMADRRQYERVYQRELEFSRLSQQLIDEGLEDVSAMLDLLRDGCTWDEIGERLGRTGDAARMKFHRKTRGIVPITDQPGPTSRAKSNGRRAHRVSDCHNGKSNDGESAREIRAPEKSCPEDDS